jgi:hypothetical protein
MESTRETSWLAMRSSARFRTNGCHPGERLLGERVEAPARGPDPGKAVVQAPPRRARAGARFAARCRRGAARRPCKSASKPRPPLPPCRVASSSRLMSARTSSVLVRSRRLLDCA